MSDFADTSFVVSYLTPDANSQTAEGLLLRLKNQVLVTAWARFEFENAIALRHFRGEASEEDVHAWLAGCDTELAEGVLEEAPFDFPAVLARTRKLTAMHTHALGTRAFDVFHVAAALELGATRFLTFDQRQASLARAAGFTVFE